MPCACPMASSGEGGTIMGGFDMQIRLCSPLHKVILCGDEEHSITSSLEGRAVQRKDRVLEALRSLCTQRPVSQGILRRHAGFSAEEVAELAEVDRTNASRDLNLLAQEGVIERIPGRPVLFRLKTPVQGNDLQNNHQEKTSAQQGEPLVEATRKIPKPLTISASVQSGAVV